MGDEARSLSQYEPLLSDRLTIDYSSVAQGQVEEPGIMTHSYSSIAHPETADPPITPLDALCSSPSNEKNTGPVTLTLPGAASEPYTLPRDQQPTRFPLHHRLVLEGRAGFDNYQRFSKKACTVKYCTALFLLYFVTGTLVYTFLFEKWSMKDSMYFIVVTFTTCGYGDLTPDSFAETIFTTIFLLVGVLVLATVAFGIIFENLFEAYETILERAKSKTGKKFLQKFDHGRSSVSSFSSSCTGGDEHAILSCCGGKSDCNMTIWRNMIQECAAVTPLLLLLILSAIVIGKIEGWDIYSTLYFTAVTATTVGYGDVAPRTESMRLFCVFFIPFAVGVTAELFGRMTGVYLKYKREEAENEFLNSRLTLADIDRMDRNGDGIVVKDEFMRFFLVSMGKVTHEELDRLEALFQKLDASHDGKLSIDDLLAMSVAE
jgi:Ca2+-binding EF-hand superfamily protein